MCLPEARIEHAENGDSGGAYFEGRYFSWIQTRHGCDGKGIEALKHENDSNSAVDAGRIRAFTVDCDEMSASAMSFLTMNAIAMGLPLMRLPIMTSVTTMPPTPIKVWTLRPRMSNMKLPTTAIANDQQLMIT